MQNKEDQKQSASVNDDDEVAAFFAKNRKPKGKAGKKQQGKAGEPKANAGANEQQEASPSQPPKEAPPNYDSDSSNEEKQQIVLDGGTKIKSMKEVKATENEEEKKAAGDNFGWGGMESKAKTDVSNDTKKQASAAGKPGEINFRKGRGPPTFTKKNKALGLAQEEFPDIGDLGAPAGKSAKGSDA